MGRPPEAAASLSVIKGSHRPFRAVSVSRATQGWRVSHSGRPPNRADHTARVALVLRVVSAGLGILFLVAGVADVVRRTPWGFLGAIGGVLILVGVVIDLRRERRERRAERHGD